MADPARAIEEEAAARRAQVLMLAYVDTTKIQKQVFKDILSTQELYQLRVVPLVADAHYIHFGLTTTTSQQTLNQLRQRFSDQKLEFSLISDSGFNEYMKLYDPPKEVHYENIHISQAENQPLVESVSATLNEVRPDDMLAFLVSQAYKLKASDIHLENMKENIRVRFRIDGVLHPVAYIDKDKYRHLLSALASSANISTSETAAQSGHISRSYQMADGQSVTINLRVESVTTVLGMDVVMRLFNLKLEFFNLKNLGLSPKESQAVNEVINNPTGLVMAVGPTGSGKTTTLYSLLNTLNTPERKIVTLEDPVEYNLPGVIQIPVSGSIDRHDFADGLRAVLRLDPDVVMVGEIRDADTAKTALQAALTGHLVLSTFHADSAAAAITRMADMVGINPLFVSALHLIMAQRLVRRLDDSTKQAYTPDEAVQSQLQKVIDSLPPGVDKPDMQHASLYRPGSSADKPFGYSGQVAIREQLVMTPGVQALLKQPTQLTTETLEAQAVKDGMLTMLQDGVLKAIAGLTSIEEIYRVLG